jgi:hypothetical protein
MRGELWLFFLFASLAAVAGGLHGAFKLADADGTEPNSVIWTARAEVVLAIVCLIVTISGLWEYK